MGSFSIFCFSITSIFCAIFVYESAAIAIRGRTASTSTCGSVTVMCRGNGGVGKSGHARAGETRFQPLGCDCALVKKRCRPENSLCIGPGGDMTENIGSGTPKRGTCGCQDGYTANCTTQTCIGSSTTTTSGACTIALATNPSLATCAVAFGSVSGSTLTTTCTKPLQLLLVVTSDGDKVRYLGVDGNTLEVYAANLQPNYGDITQTYALTAVSATGVISNQISFNASIAGFTDGCTC